MFPPQYAKAVADGSSALVVSVKASYMDAPGRRYCFDMNYIYYWPLKKYDPAGGSNDCDSGSPTYSDATTLSRLMAAFGSPTRIDDTEGLFSASFGVAALTPSTDSTVLSSAALLRRADEALYRSKLAGRNRVMQMDD